MNVCLFSSVYAFLCFGQVEEGLINTGARKSYIFRIEVRLLSSVLWFVRSDFDDAVADGMPLSRPCEIKFRGWGM